MEIEVSDMVLVPELGLEGNALVEQIATVTGKKCFLERSVFCQGFSQSFQVIAFRIKKLGNEICRVREAVLLSTKKEILFMTA